MRSMVKGKYLPDRDLQKLGKIKFSEIAGLEVEYNVNFSRESIIILIATNIIWYDFHALAHFFTNVRPRTII